MKSKLFYFFLLLMVLVAVCGRIEASDRVYSLSPAPVGWDNAGFGICYYNGSKVYDMRSNEYCSPGKIWSIKVSPNSFSFAVLYEKGKNRMVSLYARANGHLLYTFHLSAQPTAISYSANAKLLYIATDNYTIQTYNLSTKEKTSEIRTTSLANYITVSNNGYFISAVDGSILYIYNAETGRVRKVLELDADINWLSFSPDNTQLAVLLKTGKLHFYDTKSFTLSQTYTDMGEARCCKYHPEGKYISVITASNQVKVINMKNPDEKDSIVSPYNGVTQLGYAKPVRGNMMLLYNNLSQINFHELDELVPDYEHLVADEVEELMDEWMKMMPGESMEEYRLRVNDETRAAQYAKFENEVATSMAGDKVGSADVSFGSYNQDQNKLEVNFDNMPSIFLDVPQEDVAEFSQPEKLSFANSIYGVGENDQFELIYTEVTNTETGKTYVFDNLAKQSLDYMSSDDNFVPLDLIQQSSMEEVKLQAIREEVVAEAKESNLISEHTHINVKTKVEAGTDANGNKIMNYNIDFNYDVDQEFSAQEDFKPGKYNVEQSASAIAMLQIIKNAFNNEFRQYIQPGRKVRIIVTGAADAMPINNKIAYSGEYGNTEDMTVTKNGEMTSVTLTQQSGITSNDQLALARALSVQNYTTMHLTELSAMQCEYDYVTNVSNERGAEFRRIGVKFVFIDAFRE